MSATDAGFGTSLEWPRMRRRIVLYALCGIVFFALLATFVGWVALRLQAPLPLPDLDRDIEIVIDGVTVVNPGLGRTPNRRVVLGGDRVRRIGTAPKERAKSAAHPWAGAYMLPGLVDMHVHLPPEVQLLSQADLFGFLFLLHGVTSVRETGSIDGTSLDFRRRVEEGSLVGPRVMACGPFIDGDPAVWPNSVVARDPVQARAAVEELALLGVDCVKIYSRMSAEALAGVKEAAARRGLHVVGHVPDGLSFEEARLSDTQHLGGFDLLTGEADAAEALSFKARAAARTAAVVRASLEDDLAHTPTLVVFERLAAMADYETQRNDPVGRLLPRFYRDVVWHPQYGLPFLRAMGPASYAAIEQGRALRFQRVAALYTAGVRVHAGTDVQTPFVVPGASLHEELRLLVEAGIPTEAVWALATRGAGEFLGVPLLGTVQVGAPADLLIFREDPTRDLAALGTLEAVVAQGHLYTRRALDEALAAYQSRFESRLFDGLSMAVGRMAMRSLFGAPEFALLEERGSAVGPGDLLDPGAFVHTLPDAPGTRGNHP